MSPLPLMQACFETGSRPLAPPPPSAPPRPSAPPLSQAGRWMALALAEAEAAARRGEVPVGAVVVSARGELLAVAGNEVEGRCDPSAHAEILALRRAAAGRGSPRLPDCDLYVTLEPCAMCAQAMAHARLRRLYFGAYDPKGGGVEHGARIFERPTCHHRPECIGGLREQDCATLLLRFFQARRGNPEDGASSSGR